MKTLNVVYAECLILILHLSCFYGDKRQGEGQEAAKNNEDEGNMTRYVVEDRYSPAIFGSNKYNVLTQQFDLPSGVHNSTTAYTETMRREDQSTAISPHQQQQQQTPEDGTLRGGKHDRYNRGMSRNRLSSSNKKPPEAEIAGPHVIVSTTENYGI